jgi:hypothetical protein
MKLFFDIVIFILAVAFSVGVLYLLQSLLDVLIDEWLKDR